MSSKYEFIDAEKALYPVVKMCEWMMVSTSGFYEWRGRPGPPRRRLLDGEHSGPGPLFPQASGEPSGSSISRRRGGATASV